MAWTATGDLGSITDRRDCATTDWLVGWLVGWLELAAVMLLYDDEHTCDASFEGRKIDSQR